MCLSDPLYGFIVGSDGIVAIYGVESRRSPQAEGVQYLIAGAEGGDGDNMTPGRTQPLERDTLDLKKGVTDLRCSTVKRFSNIESIQNTSIIQNGAHSPNFPVAMASSICVEAGLVENYFTTASIFSKLRQYSPGSDNILQLLQCSYFALNFKPWKQSVQYMVCIWQTWVFSGWW